jgi:SPP1 gp7 family putative phage head morphogenesis protein
VTPQPPGIDEHLLAALDGRPVDDVLFDLGIRRALFLERYKSGEVRKFVAALNEDVFPDLLDKLEARLRRIDDRGEDVGIESTERLKKLATELRGTLAEGIHAASKPLRDELKELAVKESRWQKAVLQANVPLQVSMTGPNLPLLRSIVGRRPFAGATLDQWFGDLTTKAQRGVERQLTIGLTQGETVPQLVQRIRGTRALGFSDGVLEATRSEAERLVRTAVGHVSNNARLETFRANADVVAGRVWHATLDERTCPICGLRDGQVFDLEDDTAPVPPAHPNCRCVLQARTKTWKELGIRLRDAPPGVRASMDGPVKATTTWSDWIDGPGSDHAAEALGPGRVALWQAGKITLDDLVSQRDRILTLDELEKLSGGS